MAQYAVRASNITRGYGGRKALDGFSLDVPAAGVFGLLGPNGSGKSTFIAMLAATESPETGSLEILGGPPSRALRRRLATVFQENTADPLMRAGEYLRFSGRVFGVASSELSTRIPELLERFGLGDRASDPVSSLSGGMRRRLEVARALLHRPELLLLDEPTTGIDAEERAILWETLRSSADAVTILLATNDLSEADAVCDSVAFIQGGRVVASGSPAELKAGLRRESVRIAWPTASEGELAEVAGWPGTGEVARDGDIVVVTTDEASTFVPRLFALAPGAVRSVTIATASLEDAYFQHVQRRTGEAAR
ncbi:ABC transporter ATP-binding protein [Candidatus Amarobacter glycogenicus]|uniref:ABC transporter ATP-binding protein n=1 Tax=Candidatus Amarobacter glycogenicus TaxID=3140699 RepID=UPI002A0EED31|nr:ABC transporter ATP-binding protein [Dehalococcoidia bacterium]